MGVPNNSPFFGRAAQVSTNRFDGNAQDTGGGFTGTAKTTSSGALDKIKAIANNAMNQDAPEVGNGLNPSPQNITTSNISLIQNGDFESGSLLGWDRYSEGSGMFVPIAEGEEGVVPGPISGQGDFDEDGEIIPLPWTPDNGDFVALSLQSNPTFTTIYQPFTIPDNALSVEIKFDLLPWNWYSENNIGPLSFDEIDLDGLLELDDPDSIEGLPQYSRVDILRFGSDIASIEEDDVVASLFISENGADENPETFQNYVFDDMLGQLEAGETYLIRFAEVDILYFYNLAVDNVEVNVEVSGVATSNPDIGTPFWDVVPT